MSQENLEIVRRAYAVFDKDLDRLLALLDPTVEWISPSDAIEPGVRYGHQGVRDAFAATAMAWDEPTHTADPDVIVRAREGWPEPGPFVGREAVMRQWEQQRETFDADALEPITDFLHAADRVVVRFIWRGVGHGPESSMELTGLYTFRKGKVFGVEFFWDHTQALEAVGLSEEAMSQENV